MITAILQIVLCFLNCKNNYGSNLSISMLNKMATATKIAIKVDM